MNQTVTQFHCPQKLPKIQASDWCLERLVIVYNSLPLGPTNQRLGFWGGFGDNGIAGTLYLEGGLAC